MRPPALIRSLLVLCTLPVLAMPAFAQNHAAPLLYTVARRYEPMAWMTGGERFPLGATLMLKSSKTDRPLAPGFAATADPVVSFDGRTIFFSGKRKAEERWQIWAVSAQGGTPKRITPCAGDCVRPLLLPEDRIVYAHKTNGRFVIEAAPTAGGKPLRLTYAPGNFLPTDVLQDGRILFESVYPLGGGVTPELYTVYSDGSGVESYRCDHGNPRHSGRQSSDGDIVFASQGRLARFTSASAQQLALTAPAGEFTGDVVEGGNGDWLAAWRANRNAPFEIRRWKAGQSTLARAVSAAGTNAIQPALVAPRSLPKRHPSALHDWDYANLLCLNAYTSTYPSKPGTIAAVRTYTADGSGRTTLLGTAAVEPDGSFYLKVPADQPLRFELQDQSGKSLQHQKAWMWIRRGEQRVCVGCHAGPEQAPENAVPAVLVKSTTPADMTGPSAQSRAGGH